MSAPTIGRIVHYQAHGSPDGTHKSAPRAAIITQVHSETCVDLAVLNPTGMFFNTSCQYDAGIDSPDAHSPPRGGTWHWPPKV